jgi:hypothetical protein
MVKNEATLAANEVAVKFHTELPVTLFKRPALSAHIKISDDHVPATIDY